MEACEGCFVGDGGWVWGVLLPEDIGGGWSQVQCSKVKVAEYCEIQLSANVLASLLGQQLNQHRSCIVD